MPQQIDQSKLMADAERLVAAAKRAGADAADVVAVTGVSLSLDVRDGRTEESDRSEGDDVTLRVFSGRRVASVSANSFNDPDALAERAVAMARVAPEDPYAGLADADALASEIPALDLLDETTADAAALSERARAAEAAALAVSGVTKSGGASASWRLGGLVLVTSHGFRGGYLVSRHGVSVTAIAGEGTNMERDYDFDSRTYLGELDASEEIGRRAGERAVARLNPRQLSTRTAPVVYEPRAARSLLGHFTSAINGAAIARGTSFLKSCRGEKVFGKGIRITDDPTLPRGAASRPFDGEGCPALAMTLVEDGRLLDWLLDTASARELGLAPNGRATRGGAGPAPGATNLTLAPGALSQEEMLAEIGTGLLVTDLIGHGVNGITGDYSRGASGFWIEDGAIAYPVSEITLAGNLKEMFAGLVPASDLDTRSAFATPSILVKDMTIAGQ
ncbi:TldD/PmbA family protein [Stappia taiwanensis]|uniref:TldD/PmbA family protein n=1 Tax=Stappia taiwanensis TaxID=992267 RepID=A0A838XQF1_9HYPH|nr:TldD/PmbA family protein [Stappia taiwanensis]MBA4612017.1 TldD/PmbA family protein [Stappia taiwanensis]GGE91785.1 modulator protein [Stappia taiwanensis]